MAYKGENRKTPEGMLYFLTHFFLQRGMTGLQPGPQKEACIGVEISFLTPIWKQSTQMTGGK